MCGLSIDQPLLELNQEAVLKSFTQTLFALCLGSVAAFAQAPTVTPGGVGNAAGVASSTAVAPGSLVSIYGSNLAGALTSATSIPLSTNLDNVTVTFNKIAAPLLFVFGSQINAQVPFELANASSADVVVTSNGQSSAPVTIQLAPAVPASSISRSLAAMPSPTETWMELSLRHPAPSPAIPATRPKSATRKPWSSLPPDWAR